MKHALLVLLLLCTNVAWADPPSAAPVAPQNVTALVQELLIGPLTKAQSKRKRFSRAMPTAVSRRVRVLAVHTDVRGQQFVRFAVDERIAWDDQAPWDADAMVGCAYPERRLVFVRRGNQYLPASSAVGDNTAPVPVVCRPAPAAQAQIASAQ